MPRTRSPRKGSMGVWPRKRAAHSRARVRSWASQKDAIVLGFPGFKAGMTQVTIEDNNPNSITKGEQIVIPTTILECPPIKVEGAVFYKKTNNVSRAVSCVLSQQHDKNLTRSFPLPKPASNKVRSGTEEQVPRVKTKKFDDVSDFDELRLLVHTLPATVFGINRKKPDVFELAVGGDKDQKLEYAKNMLGKTINVEDILKPGMYVDAHAVTKGKGYQGPVKRFGVALRHHKSEKTKRGPGSLGPWHGKNYYRVAKAGQTGYHQRVDYNKLILKLEKDGAKLTPKGGFLRYGIIRNTSLLIKGTVPGARKRMVLLTQQIRPNKKISQPPNVIKINQGSQQ